MILSNHLIPIIILLWYIFAYIYIVFIWKLVLSMLGEIDYFATIVARAIFWICSPIVLPIIMLFRINIK